MTQPSAEIPSRRQIRLAQKHPLSNLAPSKSISGLPLGVFNMQNHARILRAVKDAERTSDVGPLMDVLFTYFVVPLEGANEAQFVAKQLRRAVMDCGCKINAQVDVNKARKQKNPKTHTILNVSTITERMVAATPQQLVDATAAIMTFFANWVSKKTGVRPIAALDEMELAIHGHVPEDYSVLPVGHYARYTVPPAKQKDDVYNVLRFHHGVLAFPALSLKLPIFFRPHTYMDLAENRRFSALTGHAEVVKLFLAQLRRLDVQPSWVYMDRGFFANQTLVECVAYHREQLQNRGVRVDFMIPTPAVGKIRNDTIILANIQKKSARKAAFTHPPSIKELLHLGSDLPSRTMPGTSWKYRQFFPNEENGPYVMDGLVLLIVNAPKTELVNMSADDAEEHEDGTFSFATYSTKPLSDGNAYNLLRGYFTRNYAEAFVQDYKGDFAMSESPQYHRRLLSICLAVIAKSIFALVRRAACEARQDWGHHVYTWTMFVEQAKPACLCQNPP